jgi:Domain of Unknown Function (DUF349)
VQPNAWKKIDAQLKAALAPLRDALAAERSRNRTAREALVAQAVALGAKHAERDAPAQVRALQAQWKAHATAAPLAPRDERILWEQFRGACDAVFAARDKQRNEAEQRKHEQRHAFVALCEQLEQLAHATDKDDDQVRRVQRELQTQWRNAVGGSQAPPGAVDARFRNARTAVEGMLAARARARASEAWQMLLAKERLCAEVDLLVGAEGDAAPDTGFAAAAVQRWDALPPLPDAWEKQMLARRDAALAALSDPDAGFDYREQMESDAPARREMLAELELLLGLETPAELRAQRLAVQVKRLRDRFKSTPTSDARAAEDLLLAWCTRPGMAEPGDPERCERIVASLARKR